MTNRKPFVNWVLHGIELPLHQNLIHWLSPTVALEQSSLRAIWDAASQAAVLILPQIKPNSQLSSCTSFLIDRLEGFCLTYRNFHVYLIRYFSVFIFVNSSVSSKFNWTFNQLNNKLVFLCYILVLYLYIYSSIQYEVKL